MISLPSSVSPWFSLAGLCAAALLAAAVYRNFRLRRPPAALKEIERHSSAIVDAGFALWDWDIEHGRVEWAGQAWKMFGVARNEDVPRAEKDVRALIPPEDNKAIDEVIFRELAKGDSFQVEFRLRQPDGRHIWVQSHGKIAGRKQGNPVRTVGIFTDVTERKKAEAEARSYQARLEIILNNMVDGLITIDEKGIVQSYNKACRRIFGYAAEEVIGRNVKMLMPSQYAENHDQYIANYVKTGQAKILGIGREVEGLRKDGTTFPLDLSVAEMRHDGERLFSGIMRDVSEHKKAEEQLRRTNEELEQFAYIASHDLKAPLRGIDNLAKWIEEDLAEVITDSAREKMALLRGRVSRLEMLLEDILQYSRAGRIMENPVETDTGALVRQIVEDRPLPKGFEIRVPANMPVLTTPQTSLEQVFLNLIGNAAKHHDKEEGIIEIGVQSKGIFYEFSVNDDGPGIPPEFHDRIFKMFQTLKPRDEKESTGLGLSIVKKLVEWQGGRVWIASEPGQRGASFRFLWPRNAIAGERRKNVA